MVKFVIARNDSPPQTSSSDIYLPQRPLNVFLGNIPLRKACLRNILLKKVPSENSDSENSASENSASEAPLRGRPAPFWDHPFFPKQSLPLWGPSGESL